ncbi:MAG: C45 family autoproteolytic acyltransferase/hydrolase [Nannocystaceae bacterium]
MASRFIFTAAPERSIVSSGLRVLAALLLTITLMMALLYSGYIEYTSFEPAKYGDGDAEVGAPEVDLSGRKVTFEKSSMAREGHLWRRSLRGTPEEIGAASGALSGRLYAKIDERLGAMVRQRYGQGIEAWAEHMLLRWDYRATTNALRLDDQRELSAMIEALPPVRQGGLSVYERLHLMQCMVDVTQRLDDFLIEGVTFAAVPSKTSASSDRGNVLVGRSLSVDLGDDFDADRIVSFYYPDGKYPFVSVGWAGLVGVVTGVNARGVFVAINPARTDDSPENGRALTIVARQILEEADNLESALKLLDTITLRSSGILTIADGFSRRAVVVEMSPGGKDDRRVIRGDGSPMVWATDHMIREVFERDAHNERLARATSSGSRFDRLGELLPSNGMMSVADAIRVLRDRKGVGGRPLGLANKAALENLRTTHAVVVDLSAMVMWVSEGPSGIGRFQSFDLRRELGRSDRPPAPLDDYPPDPLLYSETFYDLQTARQEVLHATRLLQAGDREQALTSARIALALAPDLGELHRLLGDIERDLGHYEAAVEHYRRYLELVPGRERDQEVVRGIIQEIGG